MPIEHEDRRDLTAQQIAQAVIEELKVNGHSSWVDSETHALQHQFIAEMIAERKEKTARRERIKEKVAGSIILSGLVLLIGFLGSSLLQWVRTGGS